MGCTTKWGAPLMVCTFMRANTVIQFLEASTVSTDCFASATSSYSKSSNDNTTLQAPLKRIDKPYHPEQNYSYPKRSFDKRQRAFKSTWFTSYNWFHCRPNKDTAICYIGANQELNGNLNSVPRRDFVFISTGFCNWKKADERFESHAKSNCHKTALTHETTIPLCKDVGVMMNVAIEKKREIERKHFRKVMETVQELGRQGIPFQGDEGNDNFSRMLLLRGKDHPEVAKRVLGNTNPKLTKYTYWRP